MYRHGKVQDKTEPYDFLSTVSIKRSGCTIEHSDQRS
jgi:hypothetical protein